MGHDDDCGYGYGVCRYAFYKFESRKLKTVPKQAISHYSKKPDLAL